MIPSFSDMARAWLAAVAFALVSAAASAPAVASGAAEMNRQAAAALEVLYARYPGARELGGQASAVLVFPRITKGGILIGAQAGEGVLMRGGAPEGYYAVVAGSFGLQLGVQTFGYVMMFMTEDAVGYLDRSDGWEIGIGPSIVLVDQGMAETLSSSTLRDDVYAFVFGQQGLMAGAGIQGSKIIRIQPDP